MGISFWDSVNGAVAPGYTGPKFAANQWDTVILAKKQLPGICEVTARTSRKVDPKRQPGADGANPTIHGLNPAQVEIGVRIWTLEQWNELEVQMKVLWPPRGRSGLQDQKSPAKNPTPFDISHPALSLLHIASVIVIEVDGPRPGRLPGEKMIALHCLEFLPTKGKSASVTPKRSIDNRIAPSSPPAATPLPSQDPSYTGP